MLFLSSLYDGVNMFRYILFDKWFLGGICFLVVFAFGCYLWNQNEVTHAKQEIVESAELLHQWKLPQDAQETVHQTERIDSVQNETSVKNKPVSSETTTVPDIVSENTDSESFSSESPLTAENAEDVRVSPHGFGPYPELPPKWDPDTWDGLDADGELLVRVWLKLEEQGEPIVGATVNDGRVYPTLENTVYIQWRDIPETDKRIVSSYNGDSRVINILCGIQDGSDMPPNFMGVISRNILEGNVPPEVTIIDGTNPGIDAYKFLNLQRR